MPPVGCLWECSPSPRLGTDILALHQTQERGGEGLLSTGQGLLPGLKAGNCKRKFDTKRRGKPSPLWSHTQAAAAPTMGAEGREAAGREAPSGTEGCRTGRGVCSSQQGRGDVIKPDGGPEVESVESGSQSRKGFPPGGRKTLGSSRVDRPSSSPRASTCLWRSLLVSEPHFTQPVQ